MSEARPARWKRRKEARPAEILDAALTVFAERGYAATRMDDIAARAGVTKGTIYLYFDSKDAVFRSLVQHAIGREIDTLAGDVARYEGRMSDLLRLVFAGICRLLLKSDRVALPKIIIAEAGNFPALAEFYRREVIDRGLSVLQAIVARGVATGEFRDLPAEHLARLCFAPFLMAAIWRTTFARFDAAPYDIDGLIATHLELLLAGLARRDTA